MIIGNINSYLKNPYTNNSNSTHLKKVHNSNNTIATQKKSVSLSPDDITKKKIRALNTQFSVIQNSEQQLQSGMSDLHKKEVGLNNITDIGEQLTELAAKYKESNLSKEDKSEIEKEAEKLINNLGKLMNDNKTEEDNIVGNKTIKLTGSNGITTTIFSKGIDITLDLSKVDKTKLDDTKDDKHFSSNISVKTLLENPSIIEERILNPVQTAIGNLHDSKSIIYHNFMDEYSSATSSIEELYKIGGINSSKKDKEMLQQKAMYINISALYF